MDRLIQIHEAKWIFAITVLRAKSSQANIEVRGKARQPFDRTFGNQATNWSTFTQQNNATEYTLKAWYMINKDLGVHSRHRQSGVKQ